jgi:phosphoribosyl-ATP pyrophosphohydrolase/phosphoribosyl-ATP pyrophosphohydrolase/phosphoribosyl-AMP cyclohydrolase
MKTEIIEELILTLRDRKANPKENSYTCKLFQGGDNKILKKLGEELIEFVRAYLVEDESRAVEECSDILYHLFVALEYKDIRFEKVLEELYQRHHK